MSWVTWPTWLPCPYMVKTLKKSSSPEPTDPWPWNLVCSIIYMSIAKVVQIKSLVWPWPILRQGQFGHIGFWMGKSENYLFFGNYCSLRSQSCFKHLAKWVNDVEWVSKVKVILWPWSKVTQITKLKLVFRRNSGAICNQNSYESLKENKEWKFIQMSWVTWPAWLPCPYMVKTLKKILSRTNRLMTLKLCI